MNPPQVYMCSPSWTLLPPPSPYHPLFNCLINRTLGYLAMILQVWFMTHLHQNDPGKLVVNTPTTGFLESAFLKSSLVNPYTYWSLKISHSNAHFCPNFRLSFFFFFLPAAAAAAKSLQLCPTLCDPMDCSPPGSSIRGIFQARVLEWGAIAFSIFLPTLFFLKDLFASWSLPTTCSQRKPSSPLSPFRL